MNNEKILDDLVLKLAELKDAETRAKEARLQAEAELAAAIGVPETWTGSTTSEIAGYKVTCSRRENVKIDAAALDQVFKELPVEMVQLARPCFRWTPELDKKAFDRAPEAVTSLLSKAITKTPSKISFTLKVKENKN